ncbi:hypothetical protein L1987_54669 [Smallanthus sonchifolius]|uniref:Uncharacterized protein n=1 Tax=Smallanthus sonchifolius TaxID=185202 RepID=A0ACB9E7R4_9ASTR|nr:hypothetical protein L1987_54669 [Smallanthus sonchifolius]
MILRTYQVRKKRILRTYQVRIKRVMRTYQVRMKQIGSDVVGPLFRTTQISLSGNEGYGYGKYVMGLYLLGAFVAGQLLYNWVMTVTKEIIVILELELTSVADILVCTFRLRQVTMMEGGVGLLDELPG